MLSIILADMQDGGSVFEAMVGFSSRKDCLYGPSFRKLEKNTPMNPIDPSGLSRLANSRIVQEYVRLPQPGKRCPYTGLSRTTLFELTVPCSRNGFRPVVRSYQLRRKGAVRGIRLFHLHDLFEYIEKHAVTARSQENEAADSE
jgi:hypothetical protein